WATADALLALAAMHSGVDLCQIHYNCTPLRAATSSRVRRANRPRMVALTRLIGLVLPCTLVRILCTPQSCSTSRTPGPALTPVPAPAGTRITLLAPYLPMTRCGMVVPLRETRG